MGAMGLLLLQLYYNGNSTFLRNPSALDKSPRDPMIILGHCFPRTPQKMTHEEAGIDSCLH